MQLVEQRLRRTISSAYASPLSLNYRARVTRVTENGRLCYYRPRTHLEVQVDHCEIARPEINTVIKRMHLPFQKRRLRGNSLERLRGHCGGARQKQARYVEKQLKDWDFPKLGIQGLYVNKHHVYGIKRTVLNVMGVEHQFGPSTFYQVNLEINQLLVMEVNRIVREYSPSAVLDLFSGAGNLSLPLAKPAERSP